MLSSPRYTFVVTSRNDDHGGDVLRRTQSFVRRLAEQCERHQVTSELIIVEWNPPGIRPSLADVLAWPAGNRFFSARILTVPRESHLAHNYSSCLALYQMIGKNVGIRRAAGDYVIATNIDIIFSDELFAWLASNQCQEGVLYRSDRWDIPNELQLEEDFDVLLRRAREESIRRNCREGTYMRSDAEFLNSAPNRFDNDFYDTLQIHLSAFRAYLAQENSTRKELLSMFDEIVSGHMPRLRRNYFIPLLHTNGCGDFTMLSRNDWFRLRGYPEWHIFSWNIDSILLFQAHYNQIPIEELDSHCVHYHIEHDYGSGWTPEGADFLWRRLEQRGIPYMTYEQFTDLIYELQDNASSNLFTIYNDTDWGLRKHRILSEQVAQEGMDARPALRNNTSTLQEDFVAGLHPIELGPAPEELLHPVNEVVTTFEKDRDGVVELTVQTLPQCWSYAIEVDLSFLANTMSGYWVVVDVAVDKGKIGIGILDATGSAFKEERILTGNGSWQQVIQEINDLSEISSLIFRNLTEQSESALFKLRQFRIFSWPQCQTDNEPLPKQGRAAA